MSDIDAGPDRTERRSRTVAVILAVVFLAVLGASVGFILANRDKGGGGDNVADDPSASSTAAPTPTATGTSGGSGDPTATGTRTRTNTPTTTPSYRPTTRDDCPQQSDQAAGTDLHLVLYVRTDRSEAWICQGGGRTYYQGHVRGRSFPSATSDNSIFIPNVHYEAGVHSATNGDTVYYVSTQRLRIERNGREVTNEAVVESYGG